MDTKEKKKELIRAQIVAASHVYRDNLAGKVFLYVYGDECFEVAFPVSRFLHLTGVCSRLGATDFYEKAKEAELTTGQFYFDENHPYHRAKKKLPCLQTLQLLTDSVVCVVKDMYTATITYKLGLTNLEFTLGLNEYCDNNGNRINNWFIPRTLRPKDRAIENSSNAEFIDFIFCKDASVEKYTEISFADTTKDLPESVANLLSANVLSAFTK